MRMKTILIAALVSIVAVFAPVRAMLCTVIVLVVCDLVTGIAAALKQGDRLSLRRLVRTFGKVFVYELALGLGFVVETYLLGGSLPVSKLLGGMIGLYELKSVYVNLSVLGGADVLRGMVDKVSGQPALPPPVQANVIPLKKASGNGKKKKR